MATLTEEDCLATIAEGEFDAESLLRLHMPTAKARFARLDRAIRDLLRDVQRTFPDAQFYTAGGGFHLMLGSSHTRSGQRSQHELLALTGEARISDGDF